MNNKTKMVILPKGYKIVDIKQEIDKLYEELDDLYFQCDKEATQLIKRIENLEKIAEKFIKKEKMEKQMIEIKSFNKKNIMGTILKSYINSKKYWVIEIKFTKKSLKKLKNWIKERDKNEKSLL